jgi:hypothetical protein
VRRDFSLNLLRITIDLTEGNEKDIANQKVKGEFTAKKESQERKKSRPTGTTVYFPEKVVKMVR